MMAFFCVWHEQANNKCLRLTGFYLNSSDIIKCIWHQGLQFRKPFGVLVTNKLVNDIWGGNKEEAMLSCLRILMNLVI